MFTVIFNILLFVLILGSIVLVHEFGHFIFAKMAGVYVYEFAIGMGPVLWKKKGKETEYSIRAIPIGGFCAMAGEDVEADDENKIPKNKRLQEKTAWQRFLIMFFGAGNNFIYAILLLFFVALIWGGTTMDPVITGVVEDGVAYKAGIVAGDRVLEINNHKISTSDDLSLYLALADPTKKNEFVVEKTNGKVEVYKIKPQKKKTDGETSYVYGIEIKQEKTHGFVNAVSYMYNKTISMFKQMYITLAHLFTGGVKLNQLSGPVGIYSVVGEQSKAGIASLLYLTAFLSINVGVINLLPFPAFDGCHILFIIIEKLKGSPVKPEIQNKLSTIGLALLMILMLVVTISDIIKLF